MNLKLLRAAAILVFAVVAVTPSWCPLHAENDAKTPKLIDALQLPFITNGITVTPEGRIFVAVPHFDGSTGPRVVEWRNGKGVPYPDETWNSKASATNAASRLVDVNSLRMGPDGNLWLVDTGSPAFGQPIVKGGVKLIRIDAARNEVTRVYRLDSVTGPHSFVDDVRFHGSVAYLTDAGQPGLIVLDLKSGSGYRVLDGARSTTAVAPLWAEGHELRGTKGKPVYVHADQLEISPDGRWLYFQPACGPFFRIESRWLDSKYTDKERERRVEQFSATPSTGGTAIANDGMIYLSDTNTQRILYITTSGNSESLVQDPRLLWVDAMWIDAQGFLWMPAAQLNRLPLFNNGVSKVEMPMHVYKLQIHKRPAANDHR
jgi:sugar lactone lactonase YvrE